MTIDDCVEKEDSEKLRLKESMKEAARWLTPYYGDRRILRATSPRSGKVMVATKYFLYASLIVPYLV